MDNYDLVQRCEWLLVTANISPELDSRIRSLLYALDLDRLSRCVEWLQNNQHEPTDPAKQNVERWKAQRYWYLINHPGGYYCRENETP